MADILLRQPIRNAGEFANWMKSLPAPVNVQNGLQPPAVVHLFGHLKNDHMMLRRVIFVRVRQFYGSGHDSFESCSRC